MLLGLNSWLRWGVNTQPDWTLKRKIFHTNIGAFIALLSLFLYCSTLLLTLRSWTITRIFIAEIPFCILLAMVPWFNRQGLDNLARWGLAFSAVVSQLIAVFMAFGSYLNVHFYLTLFAIVPIAFFPFNQWRSIVFLLLLNTALFLNFEYFPYPPAAEVLGWSESTVQIIRASYVASTILTMFIFMWMVELVAEKNEARLENLSLTDHLTGLPNRRFFEIVFQQEMAKSRRNLTALALAMIDIDHFKAINDSYGHDVGDEVLKHISRQLSQATRQTNVVARIGGEEFAVLLPKTSLPEAVEVAQRMRQALADSPYQLDERPLNITISIGVTRVDPTLPMAAAYKSADTALYQAKHDGRNRVVAQSEAPLALATPG